MVEDGEWRWVVAMYRRKKCGGNREREREIVEKKSGKGRRGPGKHGRSSCVAKGVLVVDR